MAFSALEGSPVQIAENPEPTRKVPQQPSQQVAAQSTDVRLALFLGIGLIALSVIVYKKVK